MSLNLIWFITYLRKCLFCHCSTACFDFESWLIWRNSCLIDISLKELQAKYHNYTASGHHKSFYKRPAGSRYTIMQLDPICLEIPFKLLKNCTLWLTLYFPSPGSHSSVHATFTSIYGYRVSTRRILFPTLCVFSFHKRLRGYSITFHTMQSFRRNLDLNKRTKIPVFGRKEEDRNPIGIVWPRLTWVNEIFMCRT
jgi:hypothetical protein